MINVPSLKQSKGHDYCPEVMKAVKLLWGNSGRGKFENMPNVLINEKRRNKSDFLEEVLKKKKRVSRNKKVFLVYTSPRSIFRR